MIDPYSGQIQSIDSTTTNHQPRQIFSTSLHNQFQTTEHIPTSVYEIIQFWKPLDCTILSDIYDIVNREPQN